MVALQSRCRIRPSSLGSTPFVYVRQLKMADQTTSSIEILAAPAAVMDVIADFDSYPSWAKGVKSATVLEPWD